MLACERTLVEGLTCLNCDSVMNPLFCDHTIECMSGSICSIEKFESSGNILYKLGCLSRTRCPRTRSLAHTDIEQCIECCTSDGCNKDGCGITNHLQTGPLCFNCDGIADPTQCHQARVCEADEVCQALSGYVPAVGRKKRAALIQKRSALCSKCCQNDLCNNYCTTTTSTTSTTPATTPVHAPCGGIFSSSVGSFSSPNYPGNYPNNARCSFSIHVSNGYAIRLHVQYLKTESCCDHLKVYDGTSESARQIASLEAAVSDKVVYSTGSYMFISFTSDNSLVYKGFTATYSIVEANTCGFFTEMSGNFSSPNYPGLYQNNKECKYIIDVPDGYVVVLHLYDIDTESCCDHVSVHDGLIHTAKQLSIYEGNAGNQTVESTTSSMLVIFSSDSSNAGHGFFATYKTHRRATCGYMTSKSGSFHSPNYPLNYHNNVNCTYLIEVPYGYVINLHVFNFSTEQCCDALQIYNGPTTSASHIGALKGHIGNRIFESTNNTMFLWFNTDGSGVDHGFTATYTTKFRGCGGNFSSISGSFSSPWFPDPYPNLSNCKYYIDVPVGYKINLTVNTFKTEGSLDYLKVYDGLTTSNNTLAELSGTYRNNTENITSTHNEMLLHFTSDVSVVDYGFRVSYKAFNDSGSRVLTSSTGSFSSPNYPHPYTNYLYCTYLIRVQSGQRINLAFTSIITEDKYDYLQVFDGSRVSDRRLLNFSGSIDNASIIQSTGNVILVLFTTDGSITERGFTATYTSHS
ncbi:CUBN [Mytilus edulis]|uniref:CUBN n=1 Tax=Mytilus edulis TaxID=6550 RepID=A0A8S3UMW9_MYTED|nr:CUBN [Mytilus edulis]